MTTFFLLAAIYYGAISLIAIVTTAIDKHRAKKNKWRVPEARLLLLGALGGALAEWITMKLIRHKTTRKKFMVTLPIFAILHLMLVGILFYLLWSNHIL
jgi:hypothetical protein